MTYCILQGHVLDRLRQLPDNAVHCVVTSPPYWGLRDYKIPPTVWGGDLDCAHEWQDPIIERATNHTGKKRWQHTRNGRDEELPKEQRVAWKRSAIAQGAYCARCGAWNGVYGLEPTFHTYIEHTALIFEEVRRVLHPKGTLWLNLGDCYAGSWGGQSRGAGTGGHSTLEGARDAYGISARSMLSHPGYAYSGSVKRTPGIKPKNLIGLPWRVALALQSAGWYLRQDIIWNKPNPMPESVTDRCTRAHEYLFLLSKSETYYYDYKAIMENIAPDSLARIGRGRSANHKYSEGGPNNQTIYRNLDKAVRQRGHQREHASFNGRCDKMSKAEQSSYGRNRRSVWTIATRPYSEAHFATFPTKLVEPCILAGTRPDDIVLDPFCGSGTTLEVALQHGRRGLGIELNPDYITLAHNRIAKIGVLAQSVEYDALNLTSAPTRKRRKKEPAA